MYMCCDAIAVDYAACKQTACLTSLLHRAEQKAG
jgi:hypothetical protein